GTSGLDVAREVAALRPGLPVVLFSGHIDEELRRKARELGVRELLGKLDAADELIHAIDRLAAADRGPALAPWRQGTSEAGRASGTSCPPTDRIARSTSFRPKRCVVTFSSGNRFDASWASASSHAL